MIIFTVQRERTITYRESRKNSLRPSIILNENVDLSEKVDPLRTGKKTKRGTMLLDVVRKIHELAAK